MADISNQLQAAAGQRKADEDFNQTVLLLHGDGTNGAQNNTFLDGSTNNFTITRNGNTTQGTFSPFSVGAGQWSNYFDGSGDYLTTPSSTTLAVGSGDFTIECWIYMTAKGSFGNYIVDFRTGNTLLLQTSSNNSFEYYNGSTTASAADVIKLNQWQHICVVRNGAGSNNVKGYVDGVQVFQLTDTTDYGTANVVTIGSRYTGSDYFYGYISNFRIVKGTAVYTSAFTPPTAPLTAITNTSLLTCQSNRFVDNSTNAFAITRNGDVRVTPFSPFAPTAAYSAGTNGGSGYFDGTGDYLTAPNNAVFDFGSGDFTIEAWVYSTVVSGDQIIYFKRASNINYGPISLIVSAVSGTNRVAFIGSTTGSSWDITFTAGATPIPTNTWAHIAVVRTGTNIYAYVNGVRDATVSGVSGALMTNSDAVSIGAGSTNGQNTFSGLISSFRVVKGTALYTGTTYTVPTAPLTAITNTSLLCNFTNAGIFDNTGKNNLETVGNAQIDTTTKKFGTGSMEFDGTGDWLFIPNTTELGFGTGNYTIEFWLYLVSSPSSGAKYTLLDFRPTSSATPHTCYVANVSGTLYMGFYNGSADVTSSSQPLTTASWFHIAYCRSSGTLKIFVNGNEAYSASNTIDYQASRPLNIGASVDSTAREALNGFIDDLRITKGVARYTAAFTPPTKSFPDQ
jgi:hypothetical protein